MLAIAGVMGSGKASGRDCAADSTGLLGRFGGQ